MINQTGANGAQLLPDWRSAAGSKFDAPYDGPINFQALIWVDRGPVIWLLQTSIAVICFLEAIMMQYLTYKVRSININLIVIYIYCVNLLISILLSAYTE